ncbi:hypothetical protein GXW82_02430 [Streptacidiphilus sp. 4-A2]|nr:hypothetical protein [Streptacidiphilus sp. 4-A2]
MRQHRRSDGERQRPGRHSAAATQVADNYRKFFAPTTSTAARSTCCRTARR